MFATATGSSRCCTSCAARSSRCRAISESAKLGRSTTSASKSSPASSRRLGTWIEALAPSKAAVVQQLHVHHGHLVHFDDGEHEAVRERRGLHGGELETRGRRQCGWLGSVDLGGQAVGGTGGQEHRYNRQHQARPSHSDHQTAGPPLRPHCFTASSGFPWGTTLSTTRCVPVRYVCAARWTAAGVTRR